jgi:hypothetical protein
MSEGWIEAVLRLNSRIVESEASFNQGIESLAVREDVGEVVSDAEAQKLLATHFRRLHVLRTMQAKLVEDGDETQ